MSVRRRQPQSYTDGTFADWIERVESQGPSERVLGMVDVAFDDRETLALDVADAIAVNGTIDGMALFERRAEAIPVPALRGQPLAGAVYALRGPPRPNGRRVQMAEIMRRLKARSPARGAARAGETP